MDALVRLPRSRNLTDTEIWEHERHAILKIFFLNPKILYKIDRKHCRQTYNS